MAGENGLNAVLLTDGVKDAEKEPSYNTQLVERFARNCTKLIGATMNHPPTTALGAFGAIGVSAQLHAALPQTFLLNTESDSLFVPLEPRIEQRRKTARMPVLLCPLTLVLPLVVRYRPPPARTLYSALKIAS